MFSQQQTVILGCFWVTFWPELPKMFSILFENLNSDDMQDDASDMPRLLLKYWEMVEIGLQTDILAHFESFFVYAFLQPMSYTPRFFQVKDIIKIYICGKFHQYSICGCGVKKFQIFRNNSAFLFGFWGLMKPFWSFLDSYSPKYCSILLKFWPEVASNKRNTVFEKSFKILDFGSNETHAKFTVLVHFGAHNQRQNIWD